MALRQALGQHLEAAAAILRAGDHDLPSTGKRRSSFADGTNHAVSGSVGWAATAKPNLDGRIAVSSAQLAPASSERKTPLWCWHHITSGRAAQRASWWMSWAIGSPSCPGGMYSLYMPWLIRLQLAPVSVVAQTPAVEMPSRMSAGLRGSTRTVLMPGCSPPATPIQRRRSGIRHKGSFSAQVAPQSSDRNNPPGIVPAQTRPGTPPGSSAQMRPSDQGAGHPRHPRAWAGRPVPPVPANRLPASDATAWHRNGRDRGRQQAAVRLRQHRRHRVAQEVRAGDVPAAAASFQLEQALRVPT